MISKKSGLVIAIIFVLSSAAYSLDYVPADGFPKAASGSYGIVVSGLGDGRIVVWNGDTVFVQSSWPMYNGSWVSQQTFAPIASGYKGDPAFMAVSPDGHTVLLGAGQAAGHVGQLYLLDVNHPANFTSNAVVATVPHYSGAFISSTLLLIDRSSASGATCELDVVDITAQNGNPKTVFLKPDPSAIGVTQFAASAPLAVGPDGKAYTMAVVFDSMTYAVVSDQLESIPAATLIGAYNSSAVLPQSAATHIGGPTSYNSGGPAGITPQGNVLIGGFGGIQVVNPATGAIVDTYAPNGMDYYGLGYDAFTRTVFPIVASPSYSMDVVFAPKGTFVSLPANSGRGLAILLIAILAAFRLLGIMGRIGRIGY